MDFISLLHKSNLILHISAGCFALLIGISILFLKKGGRVHRRSGRTFLFLLFFVTLTGLIGVFVFKRNGFLLVITTLSGYMGFSGFRAIRNRSNHPKIIDITAALLALASVVFFLWYFHSIGMMWSPVIIYSTVGYLVLAVCYDLGRYLIKEGVYQKLWLHEHIVKLVSAFSGLLSAFTGTVLPQYQPYSQFLPSILGSFIAFGFMFALWKKSRRPSI
jgi:uncharacterized membrane protein